MKTISKRLAIPAIVFTLVLAACAPGASVQSRMPSDTPGEAGPSTAADPYAEPVSITITTRGTPGSLGVPRTEEIHKRIAKEKWNIDLNYELIDKNVYTDQITAKFAAGDYPNIFYYGEAKLIQAAIDGGVILPVTKAMEDPVYDAVDRDAYFKQWYQNGEYYGFSYHCSAAEPINLRGDWLKNLGLSVPSNPAELYDTLVAFTKNDPDKNGKDDTFGIAIQGDLGDAGQLWTQFLPAVRSSPASNVGLYLDRDSNSIKTILTEADAANVKDALAWFSGLYKEGAIDPEYITLKQQDVEAKFVSGFAGAWDKVVGGLPPALAKLQASVPEAEIIAMPPVTNPYGSTNYDMVAYKTDYYFITTSIPDVDRGLDFLLWRFSPEGIYTEVYGEEGVEYELSNGEFKWLDEEAQKTSSPATIITRFLPTVEFLEKVPVVEAALEAADGYNRFAKDVPSFAVRSDLYLSKSADIDKIMLEGVSEIIVGQKPVDYYDSLLAEVRAYGVDDIAAEVNAVFQAASN
ncbi:MAG: extracellular solute-binding protein [Clostridiales bacterium]|jgi:putative aldouronate transport system substrate-binding protein|nr:extracellular solute-binding protein [Clostridiales bacterium]